MTKQKTHRAGPNPFDELSARFWRVMKEYRPEGGYWRGPGFKRSQAPVPVVIPTFLWGLPPDFEGIVKGDSSLYPHLIAFIKEWIRTIRKHGPTKSETRRSKAFGDPARLRDPLFLVSAAAMRVRKDRAQAYIPKEQVAELLDLLLKADLHAGRDVKGSGQAYIPFEVDCLLKGAIGNSLLVFYDTGLFSLARALAKERGLGDEIRRGVFGEVERRRTQEQGTGQEASASQRDSTGSAPLFDDRPLRIPDSARPRDEKT